MCIAFNERVSRNITDILGILIYWLPTKDFIGRVMYFNIFFTVVNDVLDNEEPLEQDEDEIEDEDEDEDEEAEDEGAEEDEESADPAVYQKGK